MSTLAIAKNERLKVAGRAWPYALRTCYVLILACSGASIALLGAATDQASSAGRSCFLMLCGAQFFVAAILCPLLAADSIVSERRLGTLPLLLIATCRPWHIVVGKALGVALSAAAPMLACVPLLTLSAAFAGVTAQQVGSAMLYVALALAGATSVGILLSAWCKRAPSAAAVCLLVVGAWVWGPMVLESVWPGLALVKLASPFWCCIQTLRIGYGARPAPFVCLAASASLVAISLAAAARLVSRRVEDNAARRTRPAAAAPLVTREQPLHVRLFWDTTGLGRGTVCAMITLAHVAAVALLVLFLFAAAGNMQGMMDLAAGCLTALWFATALSVPLLCTRLFVKQKADGTLPLLMTTALSTQRLALAYVWGLSRIFLPVLACYTIAHMAQRGGTAYSDLVHGGIGAVSALAACLFASLVGLAFSAFAKTQTSAVWSAIGLYALLSCAGLPLFLGFVTLLPWGHAPHAAIAGGLVNALAAAAVFLKLRMNLRRWSTRI